MEDTRNEIIGQHTIEYRDKTVKENLKEFIKRNLITLLIILAYVAFAWIFKLDCPLRRMIRRPCPACGITRAWANALQLDFKEALYFHPLFWFVPFYVWIIISREFWPIDKIPEKIYKVFTIIGGILIFGVYIFRNIVGFGDI